MMTPTQVEGWAWQIINQIKARQKVEDSRVELKSTWIDDDKMARLIAGHANAAHGEDILWLIGIDENKGVVPFVQKDLATWYSQLEAQFDKPAPPLPVSRVIFVDAHQVLALLFDTSYAPYVVKAAGAGPVKYEVPWREGTAIRSARREELLRMLLPLTKLPTIEPIRALIRPINQNQAVVNVNPLDFMLDLELFVASKTGSAVMLPRHHITCHIESTSSISEAQIQDLSLFRSYPNVFSSPVIRELPQPDSVWSTGVFLDRPDSILVRAAFSVNERFSFLRNFDFRVTIELKPADNDQVVRVQATLTHSLHTGWGQGFDQWLFAPNNQASL